MHAYVCVCMYMCVCVCTACTYVCVRAYSCTVASPKQLGNSLTFACLLQNMAMYTYNQTDRQTGSVCFSPYTYHSMTEYVKA